MYLNQSIFQNIFSVKLIRTTKTLMKTLKPILYRHFHLARIKFKVQLHQQRMLETKYFQVRKIHFHSLKICKLKMFKGTKFNRNCQIKRKCEFCFIDLMHLTYKCIDSSMHPFHSSDAFSNAFIRCIYLINALTSRNHI